jgi:hypothetical protein
MHVFWARTNQKSALAITQMLYRDSTVMQLLPLYKTHVFWAQLFHRHVLSHHDDEYFFVSTVTVVRPYIHFFVRPYYDRNTVVLKIKYIILYLVQYGHIDTGIQSKKNKKKNNFLVQFQPPGRECPFRCEQCDVIIFNIGRSIVFVFVGTSACADWI